MAVSLCDLSRGADARAGVGKPLHGRVDVPLPRGPVGGNGREPRRPNGSGGVRNLLLLAQLSAAASGPHLDGGRQEVHRDEEHCELHCVEFSFVNTDG
eukprot:scaffold35617_cov60-Phaeocystis_antarctica.AAC.4